MPVTRVTIHHEGAGTPTDVPRGADGGYSYWVGPSRWSRLQSPYTSFATKGYNSVSVDVCLSGNRNDYPVSDDDVRRIGECVADARAHGEVVDRPSVFPHRESFATSCPGDRTMDKFGAITFACQHIPPPDPAEVAKQAMLDAWCRRVTLVPLRYGSRGPDVRILIDLLRENHFLARGVSGDAYGLRVRMGVYKMKLAHPELGNTDGKNFGGAAARVLAGR